MTSNIAGQCPVFRRFTNYFHGHFPWSFFSLLEVAEISHHSQPTPRLCYNAMDISEAKEIFPTWDFMVDFPNKNGIWITTKIFQRLVTYKHQNTGIHGAQGRWRERWSMWVIYRPSRTVAVAPWKPGLLSVLSSGLFLHLLL